jgi:hypothetical protein
MRSEPSMSPEDRAAFDRLSAAMAAEAEAAPAGPPPAEQLTALTQAVQARRWR